VGSVDGSFRVERRKNVDATTMVNVSVGNNDSIKLRSQTLKEGKVGIGSSGLKRIPESIKILFPPTK
jgi:hypothetical protein